MIENKKKAYFADQPDKLTVNIKIFKNPPVRFISPSVYASHILPD